MPGTSAQTQPEFQNANQLTVRKLKSFLLQHAEQINDETEILVEADADLADFSELHPAEIELHEGQPNFIVVRMVVSYAE